MHDEVHKDVVGVGKIQDMGIVLVERVQDQTQNVGHPVDSHHQEGGEDAGLFHVPDAARGDIALNLLLIEAEVGDPHDKAADYTQDNVVVVHAEVEVKGDGLSHGGGQRHYLAEGLIQVGERYNQGHYGADGQHHALEGIRPDDGLDSAGDGIDDGHDHGNRDPDVQGDARDALEDQGGGVDKAADEHEGVEQPDDDSHHSGAHAEAHVHELAHRRDLGVVQDGEDGAGTKDDAQGNRKVRRAGQQALRIDPARIADESAGAEHGHTHRDGDSVPGEAASALEVVVLTLVALSGHGSDHKNHSHVSKNHDPIYDIHFTSLLFSIRFSSKVPCLREQL